MLPTTGSTMTAATSSGCAANSSRTAPRVVERRRQGVARRRGGHAGAVRDAEGRGAGAGLDEKAVAVPVIAAFELDDPRPAGAPRAPAGRAAIVASVPELTRRTISIDGTQRVMRLGQLDFERVGAPKAVPNARLRVDGAPRPPGARGRGCSGPQEPT